MSPQGPPRLRGFAYVGRWAYLLTICTNHRVRAFGDDECARDVLRQLLRLSDDERFDLPAYCLMPDHAHVLCAGRDDGADVRRLVHRWKTVTSYDWCARHGTKLWQRGYHDRVLRESDAVLAVARYVLMNPVRAELADDAKAYPYSGSTEYPIDVILAADEWTPV